MKFWTLFKVKKLLESDYPELEAPALCPIHAFATAISKAFFRQSLMTLTWPRGPGFPGLTKILIFNLIFICLVGYSVRYK
jgi:hypothetical protein